MKSHRLKSHTDRAHARTDADDTISSEFIAQGFAGGLLRLTYRLDESVNEVRSWGLPIGAQVDCGTSSAWLETVPEGALGVACCRSCGARQEQLGDLRTTRPRSNSNVQELGAADSIEHLRASAVAWCGKHRCGVAPGRPIEIPPYVKAYLEGFIADLAEDIVTSRTSFYTVMLSDGRWIGRPLGDIEVADDTSYLGHAVRHMAHVGDEGRDVYPMLSANASALRALWRKRDLTPFVAVLVARTLTADGSGKYVPYISVASGTHAFSGVLGKLGDDLLRHLNPSHEPLFPLSGLFADEAAAAQSQLHPSAVDTLLRRRAIPGRRPLRRR